MGQKAIRRWYLLHKWSSLVCTPFLLLLCVTGLLIFNDEIDALTSSFTSLPTLSGPPASFGAILATVRGAHPGNVPLFIGRDDDAPIDYVTTAPRPDSPGAEIVVDQFDARTGQRLGLQPANSAVMYFILRFSAIQGSRYQCRLSPKSVVACPLAGLRHQ